MLYNLTQDQIIDLTNNPGFVLVFTLITMWSLVWKGIALWKASQNKNKAWFIVLLVVNTLGILEIIYIYFISGKSCWGKKELQDKL